MILVVFACCALIALTTLMHYEGKRSSNPSKSSGC